MHKLGKEHLCTKLEVHVTPIWGLGDGSGGVLIAHSADHTTHWIMGLYACTGTCRYNYCSYMYNIHVIIMCPCVLKKSTSTIVYYITF